MAFRFRQPLDRQRMVMNYIQATSHHVDTATIEKSAAAAIKACMKGRNEIRDRMAFLESVNTLTMLHRERGQWEMLGLPYSKEKIAQKVMDILLQAEPGVTPSFTHVLRMFTRMGQFQPPLSGDLQGSIFDWALSLLLTSGTAQESPGWNIKALQKEAEAAIKEMMCEYLHEAPTAGNLLGLLDQILSWTDHGESTTRQRAVSLASTLVCSCIHLPSINVGEERGVGRVLAQMAISLVDPEKGIRKEARGAMLHLCRLLLGQKELQLYWFEDGRQDWQGNFVQLKSVGELFRKHLNERQRRACIEAALAKAFCPVRRWVSEGGLFLLSSLLGEAEELLEQQTERSFRQKVYSRLQSHRWNPWHVEDLLERTVPIQEEIPYVPCNWRCPSPPSRRRPPFRRCPQPLTASSTDSSHPSAGPSSPFLRPVPPKCRPAPPKGRPAWLPCVPPTTILQPKPPAGSAGSARSRAAQRRHLKLPQLPLDLPSSPDYID